MSTTLYTNSGGPPLWDQDQHDRIEDQLVILVESDPWLHRHGHRVDGQYVELFWLPILGPTATLLLRRIIYEASEADRCVLELSHVETARAVGIQSTTKRPSTGWFRVLKRLHGFEIIDHMDGGLVRFPTHLPDLAHRQLQRLSAPMRSRHTQWMETSR
jgi:hypothetical protein